MKCPIDGTRLVMAERQGVEIDYCPHCRGVWLDRGELDKIIERSTASMTPPPAPRRDYSEPDYEPRRKKRGSFLDDIFDF